MRIYFAGGLYLQINEDGELSVHDTSTDEIIEPTMYRPEGTPEEPRYSLTHYHLTYEDDPNEVWRGETEWRP